MFGGYKVYPMTTDGNIYALYNAKGAQVAMGTREVCETLLHLVARSPLMERPPQHYEKVAPRQRVRSVEAAGGGGESNADGNAIGVPRTNGAAGGTRASDSVGRPTDQPPSDRGFRTQDAQEDAPGLPSPAERSLIGAHPAARRSGGEAWAEPYGVLDLLYLGGRSVASYWYFSLAAGIVIGSALLMWLMFLKK